MGLGTRFLKQKAVYWAPSSSRKDGFGKTKIAEPIEIDCRWDDSHEEFLDKEGKEQISNAAVMVDRDLALGGYLWEGELADLPENADPATLAGAHPIRKFERTPTIKATDTVRTAML